MTRSKLEFAKILAGLRNDGSDPEVLAKEMTLRKLCFEIEKIEIEAEERASVQTEPPKKQKIRPFWAFLTHDSSSDEE